MNVLWKNYGVGQGGLALLQCRLGADTFNLVYDCGADARHGTRDTGLSDGLRRLSGDMHSNRIDVLVLSHLHADHVNGLSELATIVGTNGVSRVIMPAWDEASITLAAIAELGRNPRAGGQLRQRLAIFQDPQDRLQRALGSSTTFTVIARNTVDDPARANPLPEEESDLPTRDSADLKLTPRLPPETTAKGDAIRAKDATIAVSLGSRILSEFQPYCVYPKLETELRSVVENTAGIRATDSPTTRIDKVVSLLCRRGGAKRLADLLTEAKLLHPSRLAVGKRLLKLDLNRGSLAMFCSVLPKVNSVELQFTEGRHRRHSYIFPPWLPREEFVGVGALWVGDGQLKPAKYARSLTEYYGDERMNKLLIAQLPHHGSSRNANASVRSAIPATIWHVSYGSTNTFHHPSGDLVARLNRVVPLTEIGPEDFAVQIQCD